MGRRNKQLLASRTLHRGWPDSWGCPLVCKTQGHLSRVPQSWGRAVLAMRRWAVWSEGGG